ncbi:response regulator transcription factor [Rhodopirellula sp. MGV]|uniref:response regulator transcription factor n=1 Tax=Rhodopirellula sp. MGV TaxID=2023130 RepID=UPI001304378F|nr:response regulator [Rhodopirellula sp. MGV]
MNHFAEKTVSKSLYIVDDEREFLSSLALSLREFGYKPITFDHPKQLLDTVKPDEVGCVISDLRMPELGGVELIRRLSSRGSMLSVILLTAFADVETAVSAMKLGAVSVVEKPFHLQRLANEIEVAMQRSEDDQHRASKIAEAEYLLSQLSNEEAAVLDLATKGYPNREISRQLTISPRTVDRRRQSALRKLKADSVADFAVLRTRLDSK